MATARITMSDGATGTIDHVWLAPQYYTLSFGDAEIATARDDEDTWHMTVPEDTYQGRLEVDFWKDMTIEFTPYTETIIEDEPEPAPDPIDDKAIDEFITGGDTR